MASGPYSFIDIAVNEAIRQRFAAGDALVVLDTDLQKVIWANGPGAALLGFPDIETIMGADAELSLLARRQISAAPGFPTPTREAALVMRFAGRPVNVTLGTIQLPDGERGLVLTVAAGQAGGREMDEIAARAVTGFTAEAGYFAAMIDGDGRVVAATGGFFELGIAPPDLQALVAEVRSEDDRLVKRLVSADRRQVPIGIARLTDEPALHLLVAVDEGEPDSNVVHLATPALPDDAQAGASDKSRQGDEASEKTISAETDDWYFNRNADGLNRPPGPEAVARPPERDNDGAPVRFVWRTDADGRFSEVSADFARAVAISPDDVLGRHFSEIADALGFDTDGAIAGLLERRDTWSGRTVLWPIEGTGKSVPVDLAALPAYDRDRNFEGFRGFGVARMADKLAGSSGSLDNLRKAEQPPEPPVEGDDDFRDEVPAVKITPNGNRRATDKVIELAERRGASPPSGLSPIERTAFQEIGARLRADFEASERASKTAEPDLPPEPVPDDSPAEGNDAQDIAAQADDRPEEKAAPESPAPPALPLLMRDAQPLPSGEVLPSTEPAGSSDADAAALIDRLPLAIFIHSGEEFDFINRAGLELTGYDDLDQLREHGGLDALFVETVPTSTEGGHDSRMRIRRADGSQLPVKAHLQSVRWGGRSALMTSLREDLAADAQAAERRAAELRTIIDTATDGIVLIAANGTIRSLSRPAEALFGFDSNDVEGKPFATLFAIESQLSARNYLARLAEDGVASLINDGCEVIGCEASGGFIPLFMTIGRLPDDGGFCAVLRDITQWKRAEEELTRARAKAERASSQKTEFLARISHEIRTPLNAIIGFSELMIDEKFGPIGSDRYRDYLRDINRSGNHVLDLVNDLLDISKIEAGEQEMNYEAISLNETLAETIAMMQPQANRERVIIRSSLSSTLPEVMADARSVRQIALNLLSNALRYTPAGGQVVVSTIIEAGGDVVVRIRDTGVGMSLGEIDEALKPFKQINAIKSGRHGGTGLGLPLTKAMVEANRAHFAIQSAPGEGTLVEVTFPSAPVKTN